jgi:dethiobiotin synthetase
MSAIFVTGTDTDAGKTLISAALLEKARQQGKTCFGLKPVAAGCVIDNNSGQLHNSDALLLQRHSRPQRLYSQHNPIALKAAIAPHIAARQEHTRLTLQHLTGLCLEQLSDKPDFALVEGAGGWLVPLNDNESLADLAVALDLPVVLVVGLRLGCISHALLSAEAIRSRGLPLCGWVANSLSPQMTVENDNLRYLQQVFHQQQVPCLGHVPFIQAIADQRHHFDQNGGDPLAFLPDAEQVHQVAGYLSLPDDLRE